MRGILASKWMIKYKMIVGENERFKQNMRGAWRTFSESVWLLQAGIRIHFILANCMSSWRSLGGLWGQRNGLKNNCSPFSSLSTGNTGCWERELLLHCPTVKGHNQLGMKMSLKQSKRVTACLVHSHSKHPLMLRQTHCNMCAYQSFHWEKPPPLALGNCRGQTRQCSEAHRFLTMHSGPHHNCLDCRDSLSLLIEGIEGPAGCYE